jgi:hypothetical protein
VLRGGGGRCDGDSDGSSGGAGAFSSFARDSSSGPFHGSCIVPTVGLGMMSKRKRTPSAVHSTSSAMHNCELVEWHRRCRGSVPT